MHYEEYEEQRDREFVKRRLLNLPPRSTAEKLFAEGWAKGVAKATARCVAMGKVQVLERLMDEPVTPEETLEALTLEELEERYRRCEARYDSQFRRPS